MSWWERAVIYEIYPRSFSDSNGDGAGDLNGVTSRLDYLHSLGIDAIWLTPFYPSPQVDFGYDVSDYCAVDPQYGSLEDFDRLVMESERRGIRVIVDLVFNHTSDQHPWFLESRSSRANPKANWYVWRDKPNNWQSLFGHSAWQYVPERGQFYYHKFYREQPDLNWRNREVREAIYDVVRFWMNRGVAGFRLDAITSLFEDAGFRDERVLPGLDSYGEPKLSREYTENLPELHEVLRELRRVVEERPGTVLLGETYLPNIQELAKMYGNNDEVHLPMDMRFGFKTEFTAEDFRERLREAETELKGNAPLLVLDNHDNPRSATRFGAEAGKLLATLLLAPCGAALIYYGQEIGMKNHDPERREDVKDPIGRIGWPKEKGRDGERTPMQWSSAPNAGFSSAASTWLPVAPDYKTCNVEAQDRDPDSLLNCYRSLIRMRKENPALRDGDFTLVNEEDPNVLAWIRKAADGQAVLAAVNFSATPRTAEFKGMRLVLPGYGAHIRELTAP